jgi:hypothetical protein
MASVEEQLQAHIGIGENTWLTESQLLRVADVIEKHISKAPADILRKLLRVPS